VITLLSKTADTNQFIRDDAVKALDAMTDNIPPQKALAVLISHGTGYNNDLLLLNCVFRNTSPTSSLYVNWSQDLNTGLNSVYTPVSVE